MTLGSAGRYSTGPWMPARPRFPSLVRWSAVAAIGLSSLLGARGAAADGPAVVPNPVKVTVPAIGVSANVQDVGLADDGSMGVPVGYDDVAWYDLGVEPGYAGWAAFTGHISSVEAPGVFYNIDGLTAGNTIHIFGDDGTELVFIVQEVDVYKADNVPLDKIFAPTTAAGVVLITCGGDWDYAAHLFANRTVVYATLASG
jgi:sortase A